MWTPSVGRLLVGGEWEGSFVFIDTQSKDIKEQDANLAKYSNLRIIDVRKIEIFAVNQWGVLMAHLHRPCIMDDTIGNI